MPEVTEEQFLEYMKNPILFPGAFKDWLGDYFATNIPKLHVSQIYGFKLQSVKAAEEVTATNSVTSTSYADLATTGPALDHIPNGMYIALFGATYGSSAIPGFNATWSAIRMSPSLDGAAASDDDAANLNAGSNGRVILVDFTTGDGAHTIDMKYKKVTGGGVDVQVWNRWLYLLKVVTDA